MTVESLNLIDNILSENGINYEFGQWSTSPVPSPYFIGEFSDLETSDEDGMQQSVFIMTGTSNNSWLELMEAKEKIEELFPSTVGMIVTIANGSAVAIFFDTSSDIPTDTMELKRIQINLTVKEWKVK